MASPEAIGGSQCLRWSSVPLAFRMPPIRARIQHRVAGGEIGAGQLLQCDSGADGVRAPAAVGLGNAQPAEAFGRRASRSPAANADCLSPSRETGARRSAAKARTRVANACWSSVKSNGRIRRVPAARKTTFCTFPDGVSVAPPRSRLAARQVLLAIPRSRDGRTDRRGWAACRRHDDRGGPLAESARRVTDDSRPRHKDRPMAQQRGLDLHRRNLLRAAHDHVLDAARDPDAAVSVVVARSPVSNQPSGVTTRRTAQGGGSNRGTDRAAGPVAGRCGRRPPARSGRPRYGRPCRAPRCHRSPPRAAADPRAW